MTSGPLCRWQERAAVARIGPASPSDLFHEIDRTRCAEVRAVMAGE